MSSSDPEVRLDRVSTSAFPVLPLVAVKHGTEVAKAEPLERASLFEDLGALAVR